MKATIQDLTRQFDRIVSDGWLVFMDDTAGRSGTTTAHILGIGSRESNLKNIRGDFRNGVWNGFGPLQVDVGTDPNFTRNWTPDNSEPGIRRGGEIFVQKCRQIKSGIGKTIYFKGRSFVGQKADLCDIRRIATAGYNCGLWAYFHFSKGQNVDTTTTGDDYSRDVYDRSIIFAALLEGCRVVGYDKTTKQPIWKQTEEVIEPFAIVDELIQQGKYARESHKKMFGVAVSTVERVSFPFGEIQENPDELASADYEREQLVGAGEIAPIALNPAPIINDQAPATQPSPSAANNHATGDAPEVPARWMMKLEDLKPWIFKRLKMLWGGVGAVNFAQGTASTIFASFSGEYWYIWTILSVIIALITFAIAICISMVLGIVLWKNRSEIERGFHAVAESITNPDKFNMGLEFVRKT